jgi:hypothetical protein
MRAGPSPVNISGRRDRKGPALLFVFLAFAVRLPAQSPGGNSPRPFAANILPDTQSSSEFPLWARDLRRGEIVAFGSFPFTLFFSTIAVDSVRYFQHSRDSKYLPWPFKGPGAVEKSRDEWKKTLIIAAASSMAIAVIDFTIVQVKRGREKERVERKNGGGIIEIIRSPIPGDTPENGEDSPGEAP